ncbi:MAG TPA: hypothetical protein VK184_14335 [Nostocaceae cyanobacterium]|nr:hypothetical protein [Nostocaceae cyanobacterium]
MSEKLAEILEKIYKGYWHEGIGISYFSKFLPDLKNYQFLEILEFQGKKYQLKYIFEFLLSTPATLFSIVDFENGEEVRNYLRTERNLLNLT